MTDMERSNRKRDRRLRRRLLRMLFNARMGPRGGLKARTVSDVASTDLAFTDRVEGDEHLLGLLRDLEAGGYVQLIDERTHPQQQREGVGFFFVKITAKGTALVNEAIDRDPDIDDERDPEGV